MRFSSTPLTTARAGEVLRVFTKLGLTSFGGPVAHLGYFREELVQRRRWLDDDEFADLVALCQMLPGPASSELAMAIGIMRTGPLGGLLAWFAFTWPSALAMLAFAMLVGVAPPATGPFAGALQGLKLVAVAVVAQAVWGMARSLAPDRPRATIAVAAAVGALLWPASWSHIVIIATGALVGWAVLPAEALAPRAASPVPLGRRVGAAALASFFVLLVALPLGRAFTGNPALAAVDAFYRTGALVFGGGHVVLPLLANEVVATGWLSEDQVLAGYGAAQALPGPLFTIAAYLGAVRALPPNGLIGGLLALVAIFLPAVLLIYGTLPFWEVLRSQSKLRTAVAGVNAAVVGILLAALVTPVIPSAIHSPLDVAVALLAFLLLTSWRLPPWLVVSATAVTGALYSR